MYAATISCRCLGSRNLRAGIARQPAIPNQLTTFQSDLALAGPGEHGELLPWLYRIVNSMTSSSGNEERNQRLVGLILRTIFAHMPEKQVKVLEAIELGGDSLADTAGQLDLTEAETIQLHSKARARFVTLLPASVPAFIVGVSGVEPMLEKSLDSSVRFGQVLRLHGEERNLF